ncbi:putative glycosyl hydrolase [Nadsonia fulvescens var. elongata DSM 6958]|uniref:Putative glycosyl hydrolase n=1 Tax=Nadsonia fulvescens var. elongata DSM 6958 TaxID=857566 RepID=A0A1E3PJP1_9ASCO|nr:putative glycosyl hydrolase [Nadsonia fulvescens var. elongata DSM 6958]
MIMIGMHGSTINNEVRELINKYHVGTILLSSRNLSEGAASAQKLILDLQLAAHDAGYEYPLSIAVDQENGMLNNIYDSEYITQFPGPMAIAATQSPTLAMQVACATGEQMKALGVNWILGPVLDVLYNNATQLLGVRTMGDDPAEVTRFGLAYIRGYEQAGINICAKHFPGYGEATVDLISGLEIVFNTIKQLEAASLIPFHEAIHANVDAILVGGCAVPKIDEAEMHACLSHKVVSDLLRHKMGYRGVIISECLEFGYLYENVGVKQGAIMAATAGCDIIIVCSDYRLQKEAISGILCAVKDGILSHELIYSAARRVAAMKQRYLSWDQALNPMPLSQLKDLKISHDALSAKAYQLSVTLLRDHGNVLPLTDSVEQDSDILLLSPLVAPLVGTTSTPTHSSLLAGETAFQNFGKRLAQYHTGKVMHTCYTENGFIALHEKLIQRAKAVIIITTEAHRNTYQLTMSKLVASICATSGKPFVTLAVSSPYDMALDRSIGTYICAYEFTDSALETVAQLLFGILSPKGKFPGSSIYKQRGLLKRDHQSIDNDELKQKWLVERVTKEDAILEELPGLWECCFPNRRIVSGIVSGGYSGLRAFRAFFDERYGSQTHFLIRNSSTNQLYGFCATWVYECDSYKVGSISMVLVAPSRRGLFIGRDLLNKAMEYLKVERKVKYIKFGSPVPNFFPGITLGTGIEKRKAQDLEDWLIHNGWKDEYQSENRIIRSFIKEHLNNWKINNELASNIEKYNVKFDFCVDSDRILEVNQLLGANMNQLGLDILYRTAMGRADSKIIISINPASNRVIGAVIIFTRGSLLSLLQPWILEFTDARVGGICGLIVDQSLPNGLTHTSILGMVSCGLKQFTSQGFERGVTEIIEDPRTEEILIETGWRVGRSFKEMIQKV